jgi:hypothetical protein
MRLVLRLFGWWDLALGGVAFGYYLAAGSVLWTALALLLGLVGFVCLLAADRKE